MSCIFQFLFPTERIEMNKLRAKKSLVTTNSWYLISGEGGSIGYGDEGSGHLGGVTAVQQGNQALEHVHC